jgi:hypothetical protein
VINALRKEQAGDRADALATLRGSGDELLSWVANRIEERG